MKDPVPEEDPFLEELRRLKQENLARFDYDLTRYIAYLNDRWRDWPGGTLSCDAPDSKPRYPTNPVPIDVYIAEQLKRDRDESDSDNTNVR